MIPHDGPKTVFTPIYYGYWMSPFVRWPCRVPLLPNLLATRPTHDPTPTAAVSGTADNLSSNFSTPQHLHTSLSIPERSFRQTNEQAARLSTPRSPWGFKTHTKAVHSSSTMYHIPRAGKRRNGGSAFGHCLWFGLFVPRLSIIRFRLLCSLTIYITSTLSGVFRGKPY